MISNSKMIPWNCRACNKSNLLLIWLIDCSIDRELLHMQCIVLIMKGKLFTWFRMYYCWQIENCNWKQGCCYSIAKCYLTCQYSTWGQDHPLPYLVCYYICLVFIQNFLTKRVKLFGAKSKVKKRTWEKCWSISLSGLHI